MSAQFTAHPIGVEVYELGEGPVWDADRQRLLWVDISAGTVYAGRLDPESDALTVDESWTFPGTVGAAAVSRNGALLVAGKRSLIRVEPGGGSSEAVSVLPPGVRSRLNDGAVDPAGRFLVGSLALDGRRGEEVLVRWDSSAVTVLDADLNLSNGLAWSPGGDLFYSVDSVPGVVWERDYDPVTGRVGPRRQMLAVTDGIPDGLCVDAAGNLWIAIWGRGRVECRSPRGELLAVVEVDAPHTSSVAFAGPGLDLLVITTATEDLMPADLARHPDSGRVFAARVGVRGLPVPYWNP